MRQHVLVPLGCRVEKAATGPKAPLGTRLTDNRSVHGVAPTLAGIFISASMLLVFVPFLKYLVDVYLMWVFPNASSAEDGGF